MTTESKKRVTQADILNQMQAAMDLHAKEAKEDRISLVHLITILDDRLAAHNAIVAIMASDIGRMTAAMQKDAPAYRHPLGEYAAFDWENIGARVTTQDKDGATAVTWGGHLWKRRSGSGRYGKGIWFSRPSGKDDEGNVQYLRLVTFKDLDDPEPLTFDRPDNSNGNGETHPDPAAAQHLKYGDDSTVPNNEQTILVFNAYLYAEGKVPMNSGTLAAWHASRQAEAPQP